MIVTYNYSSKKSAIDQKVKEISQTKEDFITCSKSMINELGGSLIRSDNVYFANNEQASLMLTIFRSVKKDNPNKLIIAKKSK